MPCSLRLACGSLSGGRRPATCHTGPLTVSLCARSSFRHPCFSAGRDSLRAPFRRPGDRRAGHSSPPHPARVLAAAARRHRGGADPDGHGAGGGFRPARAARRGGGQPRNDGLRSATTTRRSTSCSSARRTRASCAREWPSASRSWATTTSGCSRHVQRPPARLRLHGEPAGHPDGRLVTDGQDDDYSFDTLWYSEGRLTADGYAVRLAIPFRSLRFTQHLGAGVGHRRSVASCRRATRRRSGPTSRRHISESDRAVRRPRGARGHLPRPQHAVHPVRRVHRFALPRRGVRRRTAGRRRAAPGSTRRW